MIKKIKITLLFFITVLLISACQAEGNAYSDHEYNEGPKTTIIISNNSRKIIYTVNLSIKTGDTNETTNKVKSLLLADEWVEGEELSQKSNFMTLRINTTRLDAFVTSLRNDYETNNYSMRSEDVSLNYITIDSQKDALILEKERLLVLYNQASVYEMIEIGSRISKIDSELIQIERKLNEYDSLIDYSTVKLWIYGPTASSTPPDYGHTLGNTISSGWNAVVYISKGFLQVIVFIIPFLVIIVPVGSIIGGTIYYRKNKLKNNKDKKEEDQKN